MNKYIYSEEDISMAIKEAIKSTFGWEYDLCQFFSHQIIKSLKENANLYRFYQRNCPGCATDNESCDFVYGRGKAKGAYQKARKGEIFDCPVRANGTYRLDPGKGFESIDISDRGKNPYPIIKIS